MSKEKNSTKKSEKSISFVNWFFTLLFSWLPGINVIVFMISVLYMKAHPVLLFIPWVNIIFFILTIAFAKTRSKRNYAIAGLVLSLIILVAFNIFFWLFSDNVGAWINALQDSGATSEVVVQ